MFVPVVSASPRFLFCQLTIFCKKHIVRVLHQIVEKINNPTFSGIGKLILWTVETSSKSQLGRYCDKT
jgi:hypothetical protein